MPKTNGFRIAMLLVLSQVLVITGCQGADQPPIGFQVLGSKTPDRYNDYPIPSGFTERMPENLNTVQMAYTAQEKSRGYVVFITNYLDVVFPYTQPERSEVRNQISMFPVRGEYEPATFSIHALQKLDDVRVTVSPLKSGNHTIGANCLELRSVRCIPARVWKEASYIIKPTLLEKRESVSVEAGQSQRFWLTVWIPETKHSGTYTGTVTIPVDGMDSVILHVKHEVLDLVLEQSNIPQGMYYWSVDRNQEDWPPLADEILYKDMMNMKEHGMNTMMLIIPPAAILLHSDDPGKISYDVSPLRSIREAVLAADFRSVVHNTTIDCIYNDPIHTDGTKLVGAYVEALENDGWPEVIYSYGDETDHDRTRKIDTLAKLAHFKSIRPDLRSFTTIAYPENSEVFEPHLDIRPFSGYAGQAVREKTRAAGREFWI